jgi:hypothetical protein
MDPDAALREIRATLTLIKAHRRMTHAQLDHLAELFDGLDGWITMGGFLPAAWRAVVHEPR